MAFPVFVYLLTVVTSIKSLTRKVLKKKKKRNAKFFIHTGNFQN